MKKITNAPNPNQRIETMQQTAEDVNLYEILLLANRPVKTHNISINWTDNRSVSYRKHVFCFGFIKQ